MKNEARSLRQSPPPVPAFLKTNRRDSGEHPIPSSRRRGENDNDDVIEVVDGLEDASETPLEEGDVQEANHADIMKQAEGLAQDFPGLILDQTARENRLATLETERVDLNDRYAAFKGDERDYARLRGRGGVGSDTSVGLGRELPGIAKDGEYIRGKLKKVDSETQYLQEHLDAVSDVEARLQALQHQRTRVENNPLSLKGVDAKIAKLTNIKALLQDAAALEEAHTVTEKKAPSKQEVDHSKVKLRRERQAEKPNVKELPKKVELISQQEIATAQKESARRDKETRLAPYRKAVEEQKTNLEILADELAERGEYVQLPWDPEQLQSAQAMAKEVAPVKSFMNRFRDAFKSFIRSAEAEQLLAEFAKAKDEYLIAKVVLKTKEGSR